MRWIFLLFIVASPVYVGCSKESSKGGFTAVGNKIGAAKDGKSMDMAGAPKETTDKQFVAHNLEAEQGLPNGKGEPEKKAKEQPRKIRYTADMKLIVEKIDDAEEALDAAKKEAKGEYAKVEINNSSGVVRSGTWRIRVPVDNLHSFRKAVAKIGEVERNTLESEDMTAQYHDLDAHITNRKLDRDNLREFIKEMGKKDVRYRETMRELETVTDEINRKEGQLKLWKDLTDLTTFTVHMREKQPFVPETKIAEREIPTFGKRASTTWNDSWENFVALCQWIAIVVIAVTPWLPIPLIFLGCVFLIARRLARSSKPPVVVAVVEEPKKIEKKS